MKTVCNRPTGDAVPPENLIRVGPRIRSGIADSSKGAHRTHGLHSRCTRADPIVDDAAKVISIPVLEGLHHEYQVAA